MSQERRALGAFLILATLAAVLAVTHRPAAPSQPATAERAGGSARVTFAKPMAVARDTADARARTAARRAARAAELAERRAQTAARSCANVPLYPLARPGAGHRDRALLRAVSAVPGVPPVTRMESFSLGKRSWLGGRGVSTAFRFYGSRMRPIGFALMPAASRRVIGVRPVGSVDSPPLLYVNRTGAALLQGLRSGVVRLTLFCGPVEL